MPQAQNGSFNALRNLVRQRDPRERCELCGKGLNSEHQHLIEPVARKLICACDACAVLFHSNGDTRYKRVPRRIRLSGNFQMSDSEWESLSIPIGVAFFLKSSVENKAVAFYPGPAGATESLLSLEAWNDIVRNNPELARMEPDVEALLVNRLGQASEIPRSEYYLVPIDKCYELVGLIRSRWRGFSGGTEAWEEIRRFFENLRQRAVPEQSHA
ncbi:MAG: hypothetical protein JOZ48_00770 [Acidobacteriaceae bacterium]|nr:hypothetical protein [Acidobacteriaceae bacterium]